MSAAAEVTPLTTDAAAVAYACAIEERRALADELRVRLLTVAAEAAPALRAAIAAEADAHAALLEMVRARQDLYEKPRSRQVAGVKFGWKLDKPSIEVPDEAETISRIERTIPAEQADLLVRVKKTLNKDAVLDLTAADLRRLQIVQHPGKDAPFVSAVKSDADKLVAAVIAEIEEDAH